MQEPLPAPRRLLADLFSAIAALPAATTTTESLATLPSLASLPALRPLLATLHVLFPTLVLPALDLLDRRRIVRWGEPGGNGAGQGQQRTHPSLYEVQGSDTPHMVYLRVWHCTCASFALRAGAPWVEEGNDNDNDDIDDDDEDTDTSLYFSTPPCRHLLACLLAEAWPHGLRAYVVDGKAKPSEPEDRR